MRKALLALILTGALSACSASGQKEAPLAAGQSPTAGATTPSTSSGLGSPGAVISASPGTAASATTAPSTATANGAPAVGGVGSGGPASGATGGGPTADLRTGRGVTASTINLGIMYSSDQSAAGASLGGSGAADPQKETAKAVVDYINTHGGIAGRKINPTWFDIHYTDGSTDASRAQEQCAAFTEDSKVFAAGPFPVAGQVQATCLKKAGVVMVNSWYGGRMRWDDQDMRNYPNLWTPEAPTFNRAWTVLVKEAKAQGYFSKGAKVGAVIFNTPSYVRSVDDTLRPKLKALGVTLTDVCKMRPVLDVSDVAGAQTDTQSCVLKFRSEGIDHVMGGAPAATLMSLSSDSSSFQPRYALFTGGMGGEQSLTGSDITGNFHNVVGVGWEPQVDTRNVNQLPTSFSKTCLSIVKNAGVNQANTSESFSYCDYLFFVKAALAHAPAFTIPGFAQGARAMKSSFVPSVVLGDSFTNRNDGPSLYRRVTYDFTGCHDAGKENCWKYASGPLPF